MSCSQALILLGGICEVLGVLAVVREISRDVRRAAEIEPRERVLYPVAIRQRMRRPVRTKSLLRDQAERGLEERLSRLETVVVALEEELQTEDSKAYNDLVHEMQQRLQKLRQGLADETRRVDRIVAEILRGSVAWRVTGVALILVGIALNVAGAFA